MFDNVIGFMLFLCYLFVFCKSYDQLPVCLPDVGGVVVGAVYLVYCTLSKVYYRSFGCSLSLTFVSACRRVVIGLRETRVLYGRKIREIVSDVPLI